MALDRPVAHSPGLANGLPVAAPARRSEESDPRGQRASLRLSRADSDLATQSAPEALSLLVQVAVPDCP